MTIMPPRNNDGKFARPQRVLVYTKENCQPCRMTKMLFDANGVEYDEVDITNDPKRQADLYAAGHREMPVVITSFEVWTGFRPQQIRGVINGRRPN